MATRLFPLLALGACTVPVGQQVDALLLDHTLPCEPQEDGRLLATLQLDGPDDVYLAEATHAGTGRTFALAAERVGSTVWFECKEGQQQVTARTVSVQASVSPTQGGSGGPPGGGSSAPGL